MKFLAICIIIISTISAKAQLAVIKDTNGFVNIRAGKGINTKIVGKLKTGQIVLFDGESNEEWVNVFFGSDNESNFSSVSDLSSYHFQGYVHKSRLISIANMKYLRLRNTLNKKSLIVQGDSLTLNIGVRPFSAKNHKIHRSKAGCTNCTSSYVDKIDGTKPWGVDGGLPTTEIYNIAFKVNNSEFVIPAKSYNDLYQPSLENAKIYVDKSGNYYLYIPNNSDGAGGYDVVWVFNNGKLIRRYVDSI
jgi:hypothetical protein